MRPLMCVSRRVCMSVFMRLGSNERVAACEFARQLESTCVLFIFSYIRAHRSRVLVYSNIVKTCVVLLAGKHRSASERGGGRKKTIVWRSSCQRFIDSSRRW